ncbi:MAG: hypothetical protein AseanaTS_05850 [Candidatus Pelagadaptatus aseana]|uniref:hypothetical protein n=1 Tax=Candidatus Pelagadaptatus aseana TaxID=3120508 RepID=UPI0039B1A765
MTTLIRTGFLIAALLIPAATVWAQQAAEENTPDTVDASNQQPSEQTADVAPDVDATSDANATSKKPIDISNTSSTRGRFIPSEEVSEDLSISFPADI